MVTSTEESQQVLPVKAVANHGATYNLHTLGWASFQTLCGTILREILGQTYQVFANSTDAGRDGAFYGTWKAKTGETYNGNFVAQCKFTAKQNSTLQLSQLSGEIEKVRKLGHRGLAKNYILM